MSFVLDALNAIPFAGLMLVVTLGFFLGRLSFRGISLGPSGGTLLVAMAFGVWGLRAGGEESGVTLGAFGFALFIYSIGFEAGPRFFSTVAGGQGWRFAVVGASVNVFAVAVAVLCGHLFDLGGSMSAGLLAGCLTSVPTYAAAAEMAADDAILALSFVCSYPVGLLGLGLLVQVVPRLLGEDLARADGRSDADTDEVHGQELRRAFEVSRPEVLDKTLAELALARRTGCYVTRIQRGGVVWVPEAETRLTAGDHVMAHGRLDELQEFGRLVGPEVYDESLRSGLPPPREVLVRHGEVVGKTLAELPLRREYHCLVTEVVRAGVVLEAAPDLRLQRYDVARVVGRPRDVHRVAHLLGGFERSGQETDIAIYAGGILLGLLLGQVQIGGGYTLGPAVGLLTTGVLLGRLRRIGPVSPRVPPAARQLVRDLGIMLFIGETGLRAGAGSWEGLEGTFWPGLAASLLITILPLLGALLLARHFLRLDPFDAWGSVAGGMTSSAALVGLRRAVESDAPAISYTAAYAVASVLATLAGQVVIWLL